MVVVVVVVGVGVRLGQRRKAPQSGKPLQKFNHGEGEGYKGKKKRISKNIEKENVSQ